MQGSNPQFSTKDTKTTEQCRLPPRSAKRAAARASIRCSDGEQGVTAKQPPALTRWLLHNQLTVEPRGNNTCCCCCLRPVQSRNWPSASFTVNFKPAVGHSRKGGLLKVHSPLAHATHCPAFQVCAPSSSLKLLVLHQTQQRQGDQGERVGAWGCMGFNSQCRKKTKTKCARGDGRALLPCDAVSVGYCEGEAGAPVAFKKLGSL